jgi:hypothetical protein
MYFTFQPLSCNVKCLPCSYIMTHPQVVDRGNEHPDMEGSHEYVVDRQKWFGHASDCKQSEMIHSASF